MSDELCLLSQVTTPLEQITCFVSKHLSPEKETRSKPTFESVRMASHHEVNFRSKNLDF
jgi:hypothetical protein